MGRNTTSRGRTSTAIQRPRFPCLKPKDEIEILQYLYGREYIIERLTILEHKFRNLLDFTIKPIIRDDTEPWEILRWYRDAVTDYFGSENDKGYSHNIDIFILNRNEELLVAQYDRELPTSFTVGTEWIKYTTENYQQWMRYIFGYLDKIGCPTVWDHINEYDCEHMLMDTYEQHEGHESDDEELIKDYKVMAESIDKIKESLRPYSSPIPFDLIEPTTVDEKTIHDLIIEGLDVISKFEDRGVSLYSYQDHHQEGNGELDWINMYFICTNGVNWTPFFEVHVYHEFIELSADNFGVSSPVSYQREDEEFEEDSFDITPLISLHRFFHSLIGVEESIYKQHETTSSD